MRRPAPILVILLTLAATARAHDIPNARVDRSIQATARPGRLEIDYEVSLSELTLTQDLRALIGVLAGADRGEWFDRYGRETGPLNAKGFLVAVDGQAVELRLRGFDLAVEEHPRYTFHFDAPLPARGRLAIHDTNFAASEGTSRLAVRGLDGVELRGDELPPVVDLIPIRPVWQLTDDEERRTKQVEVDFRGPAIASLSPRPPLDSLPRGESLPPSPLAGEGRGGGADTGSTHAPVPHPGPPPQGGRGSVFEPASGVARPRLGYVDARAGADRRRAGGGARGPAGARQDAGRGHGGRRAGWHDPRRGAGGRHHRDAHRERPTGGRGAVAEPVAPLRRDPRRDRAGAGFLIAAIGLWRLGRHLAGYGEHDREEIDPAPRGARGLVGLGVAGGLVPCWDAVGLVVLAEAVGRLALGVALLVAFGLGMAAVLVAVGWLAARLRRGLVRRGAGDAWEDRLGIASGLVLAAIGLYLMG